MKSGGFWLIKIIETDILALLFYNLNRIIIRKEHPLMKSEEELNALKEEAETMNRKLHELTDEDLAQGSGGISPATTPDLKAPVEPQFMPPQTSHEFIHR